MSKKLIVLGIVAAALAARANAGTDIVRDYGGGEINRYPAPPPPPPAPVYYVPPPVPVVVYSGYRYYTPVRVLAVSRGHFARRVVHSRHRSWH